MEKRKEKVKTLEPRRRSDKQIDFDFASLCLNTKLIGNECQETAFLVRFVEERENCKWNSITNKLNLAFIVFRDSLKCVSSASVGLSSIFVRIVYRPKL